MVHHSSSATLDRVFSALSDATRRDMLERLGRGPLSLGDLAAPAGITLTGTAKHVRVLEDAGLVTTSKVGRERRCALGRERLDDALAWIDVYQRLWERRLDGLEAYFARREGGPA